MKQIVDCIVEAKSKTYNLSNALKNIMKMIQQMLRSVLQ